MLLVQSGRDDPAHLTDGPDQHLLVEDELRELRDIQLDPMLIARTAANLDELVKVAATLLS